MLLRDAITDYLNHIRHKKGLAKTTCAHYTSWLHAFARWCEGEGYPEPTIEAVFLTPVLRRYQYAKSKTGVRPRTMLTAFAALRGMGVFLVEHGFLAENPVAALTLPKKDAALRAEVTDAEVHALFAACERLSKAREVALCRAVPSVLAYGALRREELCDLKTGDVNLADRSLLVRCDKGSKSRKVFLCTAGVEALREWLVVREKDCTHEYLFCIDRRRRVHHTAIASLLETMKAGAGLRDRTDLTPHCLRHWAASNALSNGMSLRDVQQLLGHSDIVTTSKYLHTSEERLRDLSELTALRPSTPERPKEEPRPRLSGREPERKGLRRTAR